MCVWAPHLGCGQSSSGRALAEGMGAAHHCHQRAVNKQSGQCECHKCSGIIDNMKWSEMAVTEHIHVHKGKKMLDQREENGQGYITKMKGSVMAVTEY